MEEGEKEAEALQEIYQESTEVAYVEGLKDSFDAVVGLNGCLTARKGQSIVIYGLDGSIGGYIDNPESNTLFHCDVGEVSSIKGIIKENVSRDTAMVHFFVPGAWEMTPEKQWILVPRAEYTERLLMPVRKVLDRKNIPYVFHCYQEEKMKGNERGYAAGVNADGGVFTGGADEAGGSGPAPEA